MKNTKKITHKHKLYYLSILNFTSISTRIIKSLGKSLSITLAVLTFSLIVSCDRQSYDRNNPTYVLAKKTYDTGDKEKSLELYLRYLRIKPESIKANYEVAVIYQESNDYVNAIYYYQKYLQLDPDSLDRGNIEKWINSSKKALYEELNKDYSKEEGSDTKIDLNLIKSNSLLKKELNETKKKNEQMKAIILKNKDLLMQDGNNNDIGKKISDKSTNKNNKEKLKITTVRYYKIESGDTLSKISKKFYGSAKYYRQIIEKNHNLAKNNAHDLMPGDRIIIPYIKKTSLTN